MTPESDPPSKPPIGTQIFSERIDYDNKTFYLDVLENERGLVLKITEVVRGRVNQIEKRSTVLIPVEITQKLGERIQWLAGEMEKYRHLHPRG